MVIRRAADDLAHARELLRALVLLGATDVHLELAGWWDVRDGDTAFLDAAPMRVDRIGRRWLTLRDEQGTFQVDAAQAQRASAASYSRPVMRAVGTLR